jgi:hypothetical protein
VGDEERPSVSAPCDAVGGMEVLGLPPPTIKTVDTRVGAYFLQPLWSKRDFSIRVPGGNGSDGVILADTRTVADDYTVAPVLDVQVTFENLNLLFKGVQYSLSSSLDQAVVNGSGQAALSGTSSLNLREATAAGVGIDLRVPNCLDGYFKDRKVQVSCGPYYLYLDQDYSATLASGNNTATLHSHETFEGLGLASSLEFRTRPCPIGDSLWCYDLHACVTGAVIVGQNNRRSDFSVTGGLNPAVHDNATDFIPVGIVDLALEFERKQAFKLASAPPGLPEIGACFRVGFMGQVIGGVGMPSAQSMSPRAFENGSLYLLGFGATFGLCF